jgi:hypothetical protein
MALNLVNLFTEVKRILAISKRTKLILFFGAINENFFTID